MSLHLYKHKKLNIAISHQHRPHASISWLHSGLGQNHGPWHQHNGVPCHLWEIQSRKGNFSHFRPLLLPKATGIPWPGGRFWGWVWICINSTIPLILLDNDNMLNLTLLLTCHHHHISSSASLHSTHTTPFSSFPPTHHIFSHPCGTWHPVPWGRNIACMFSEATFWIANECALRWWRQFLPLRASANSLQFLEIPSKGMGGTWSFQRILLNTHFQKQGETED